MKKTAEEIRVTVYGETKRLRMLAGQSGSHNDGGASQLESNCKFFLMGVKAADCEDVYSAHVIVNVPQQWEKFFIKAGPEYKEYLKLKEKYEHL